MERMNALIVGGGIVGLAIGRALSGCMDGVAVVEKEFKFGQHTSSRNSEVIHSGIYYPPGSLKARLCTRGNTLLYDFLQHHQIPHRRCGKIVVAVTPDETPRLVQLKENGQRNQVRGLRLHTAKDISKMAPLVRCDRGLFVPSAGILDTHRLMQVLEILIEKQGGMIAYHTEVTGIERTPRGYRVTFSDTEKIETRMLINSAGLFSDRVARMGGLDTDKLGLRLYWGKGEYYKTPRIRNANHLIYPLPPPSSRSLGIHLTCNLAGETRFGPNLFYTRTLDYSFDESYREEFHEAINRYIEVSREELAPDETGIRPKLQGPRDPFRDFYIQEETPNGLPGLVNLIGIESPGITAALAIAEMVKQLLKNSQAGN